MKSLTLEIENLGPIVRGRIPLSRLTILIGPNSSGKTYVTELIYAIIKALRRVQRTRYLLLENNIRKRLAPLVESAKNKIVEQVSKNIENIEISIDPYEFLKKLEEFISSEFSRNFTKIIERTYRTGPEKLVTANRDQSNIKIFHQNIEFNININRETNTIGITTKIAKLPKEVKIQINPIKGEHSAAFVYKADDEILLKIYADMNTTNVSETIGSMLLLLFTLLVRNILEDLIRTLGDIMFIPAPRKLSILTEYGRIFREILKECYPSITRIRSTISEVAPEAPLYLEEFLMYSILSRARSRLSGLYNVVRVLEKLILCGSIYVKEGVEVFRDFRFNTDIEPHLASASVQQLSEIVILLKYLPSIGSRFKTLIIEEPELHCHPQTQTFIALFLAALANSGINIIVTTHSDFLIQRIYSLTFLGELKMKDPQKYEKAVDELCNIWREYLECCNISTEELYNIIRLATLSSSSLSLISFKWSKEHGGFIAEPYDYKSRTIPTMSDILNMLLTEDIIILEKEKNEKEKHY
ncbi:MAG: AAA family ATPase [Crenarchaeota archaeon]|nr:AAA family ATPase [Thermoproteota archaeon]